MDASCSLQLKLSAPSSKPSDPEVECRFLMANSNNTSMSSSMSSFRFPISSTHSTRTAPPGPIAGHATLIMDLDGDRTWADSGLTGIPPSNENYYLDSRSGQFLQYIRGSMPYWMLSLGVRVDETSMAAAEGLFYANHPEAPQGTYFSIY